MQGIRIFVLLITVGVLVFSFNLGCASSSEKQKDSLQKNRPTTASSSSSSKSARQIVQSLEKKYSELFDFQMNFTQEVHQRIFNRKIKTQGVIYSIRPGKFFWHTLTPPSREEKWIISGTEQWIYQPTEKTVYYSLLKPSDFLAKITLLFLNEGLSLLDTFYIQLFGKNTLALYPRERIPDLHRVELIYDPQTYFMKSLNIVYRTEKITTITFSALKTNQDLHRIHKDKGLDPQISKTDFRFEGPKNIQVVPMSDS
ncbi:MAG: outer membrane lipoprotein carrier protein LolA [Deltaproteobacteria bacterium]|nr:outer membrane lipoprotein carrier protein LolA [Deltaproteobacteria bacterium]